MRLAACALLFCSIGACAASAGAVLDRVRTAGVVRCGAVIRPGLAFPAPDGTWHGLEADICRAIAVAVLGPDGRYEVHAYAPVTRSFDAVRAGEDDVSFLTTSEILGEHALSSVLPGPAVFYSTSAVMVPAASPARHLADLAGMTVCAEPGTGPERTLIAWSDKHRAGLHVFMFQESDEMLDAFYSGRCDAIAHDAVNLAAIGLQAAADGHRARLLPEPLAAAPVLATTPRGDGDWAAIAGWTVATLLQDADAESLPLAGAPLGLADDWQAAVLKTVGTYRDIYGRTVGAGSPLDLPPGLNAVWNEGGLICPPVSQ